MRTWIFQGNPEVFDIEGYLAASSGLITWTVARYADQISPGDTIYTTSKGKMQLRLASAGAAETSG